MSGRTVICGIVGLSLAMPGCAGWKNRLQSSTVTTSREERTAQAVQAFEEHRDAVQLEAAIDRWNQGDAPRAEAMLTAIIGRRPNHADARLRLAEILWSRGDVGAEAHLRAVIAMQPDRAEAYHALGLVLVGTGRGDEARQHFVRAAELEPANEVYCLTRDSLASG